MAFALRSTLLLLMACFATPLQAWDGPTSESLLPETTKGFFSVPDIDRLREQWNEMQLGQLASDPIMKPFVEDLKRQIANKLSDTKVRLGIGWDDIDGIYSGEVATAMIQPGNSQGEHALVMIVDVTGNEAQAQEVLKKVESRMAERNAKRSESALAGTTIVSYQLPRESVEDPQREAHLFLRENRLVAADHLETAQGIVRRLAGEALPDLAGTKVFQETVGKCEPSTDTTPTFRWFVEPFGYAHVIRAAAGGRKKRGTDLLKVLSNQGFTAIHGAGGLIYLATADFEALHHTKVYAPEKFTLAARMLNFPNSDSIGPGKFIPRNLSGFLTINWKMKDAFDYSKSLVNELMGAKEGEDLFEDILNSIAHDADGPRVDLRTELVAYLAEQATLVTKTKLPVTPDSERLMVAVRVSDLEQVTKTIRKLMEADDDAREHKVKGLAVWEIVENTGPIDGDIELDLGGDLDPFGTEELPSDDEDELEAERAFPNLAVTVAHGHILITSHYDFMVDVLETTVDNPEALSDADDYKAVEKALAKLDDGPSSMRMFTRTDDAYQATYELLRQGKMPEAKSLFGKLLNQMMGPEEDGVLREQQIDGSKLPPFENIRQYLGPAGISIRSLDDGWLVSGCLIPKEVPALALKPTEEQTQD